MATYGVTVDGFKKKPLLVIKSEIEAGLVAVFGDINLAPSSVFGQFVGVMSIREAAIWDEMENVYHASTVHADGVSFENVAAITGITLNGAASTVVVASLFGAETTTVSANSEMSSLGNTVRTSVDVTITEAGADTVDLRIGAPADATTYDITLNGNLYSFTSGVGATENSILLGLQTQIDAGFDATTEFIGTGALRLRVANSFNMSVSRGVGVGLEALSSPVESFTVTTGEIAVPINTLTNIITGTPGWDSVTNFAEGVLGRAIETIDEMRPRRLESIRLLGGASVLALEAALKEQVVGVTSAKVFENDTDTIDAELRPPHSIEAIVEGGTLEAVAEKIFAVKAGGIATFGNTSFNVPDGQGNLVQVFFSRPTPIYIWLEIDISLYSEEIFPLTGVEAVKQAVVEQGNDLNGGVDVILQRLHTAVYTVPGIGTIEIRGVSTLTPGGPPGAYSTADIPVGAREVAKFDEVRVTVAII